jgi:hypothetical protein
MHIMISPAAGSGIGTKKAAFDGGLETAFLIPINEPVNDSV